MWKSPPVNGNGRNSYRAEKLEGPGNGSRAGVAGVVGVQEVMG